jgi:hypothetical protein
MSPELGHPASWLNGKAGEVARCWLARMVMQRHLCGSTARRIATAPRVIGLRFYGPGQRLRLDGERAPPDQRGEAGGPRRLDPSVIAPISGLIASPT